MFDLIEDIANCLSADHLASQTGAGAFDEEEEEPPCGFGRSKLDSDLSGIPVEGGPMTREGADRPLYSGAELLVITGVLVYAGDCLIAWFCSLLT